MVCHWGYCLQHRDHDTDFQSNHTHKKKNAVLGVAFVRVCRAVICILFIGTGRAGIRGSSPANVVVLLVRLSNCEASQLVTHCNFFGDSSFYYLHSHILLLS
jgi:hypothetical protein